MSAPDQQAFPCINPNYDGNWDKRGVLQGMTMRQYYKAAALHGMLSNPSVMSYLDLKTGNKINGMLTIKVCQIADAMLAEDEEHTKKAAT